MSLSIRAPYSNSIHYCNFSIIRYYNIPNFATPTWSVEAEQPVGVVPWYGALFGPVLGSPDDRVRDALVEVSEDLCERARDAGLRRRLAVERDDVVGVGLLYPAGPGPADDGMGALARASRRKPAPSGSGDEGAPWRRTRWSRGARSWRGVEEG